jgi:ferritin-like protein
MKKSIPISLAVIALSVASVAGSYFYDRAKVAAAAEARQEQLAELAQQEARQQCLDRIELLSASLLEKNTAASQYAPAPHIKNPENLKDVQAVLYKNLRADITAIKTNIARLRKQCGTA